MKHKRRRQRGRKPLLAFAFCESLSVTRKSAGYQLRVNGTRRSARYPLSVTTSGALISVPFVNRSAVRLPG
jgi:hypothetical protein